MTTTTAVNDGMAEIIKHDALQSRRATSPTVRCDGGCGAQAYVQVILKSGTVLWFCSHEYNKLKVAEPLPGKRRLLDTARTVNDYRIALQSTN